MRERKGWVGEEGFLHTGAGGKKTKAGTGRLLVGERKSFFIVQKCYSARCYFT